MLKTILELFLWVDPFKTSAFVLCLCAFIVLTVTAADELSPRLTAFWLSAIACVPIAIWMYGLFTFNNTFFQAGRTMLSDVVGGMALITAPAIIIRQLYLWLKAGIQALIARARRPHLSS